MAEIAQTYLGNIHQNSNLARLVADNHGLKVFLSPSDRTKGRIHTYTEDNIAVGIIKNRDRLLDSGDVFQTESGKLLSIGLKKQKLLVLDLSTLETDIAAAKLIQLGHALGNHHCAIAIQNSKIYVSTTTDLKAIEQTIADLQIPGLQIAYEMLDSSANLKFSSHSH